jgi:hypothetical protein
MTRQSLIDAEEDRALAILSRISEGPRRRAAMETRQAISDRGLTRREEIVATPEFRKWFELALADPEIKRVWTRRSVESTMLFLLHVDVDLAELKTQSLPSIEELFVMVLATEREVRAMHALIDVGQTWLRLDVIPSEYLRLAIEWARHLRKKRGLEPKRGRRQGAANRALLAFEARMEPQWSNDQVWNQAVADGLQFGPYRDPADHGNSAHKKWIAARRRRARDLEARSE